MKQSIIEQYRYLHDQGRFEGHSLRRHLPDIAKLVQETGAETLLDYGCGKAICWRKEKAAQVFNMPQPTLYDPGIRSHKRPVGQFDGVICTDVLEHVENPEEVISWLIGYARKFLFLSISVKESGPKKKLPDGRPFHICVHPPEWWRERISAPHLRVELRFDEAG